MFEFAGEFLKYAPGFLNAAVIVSLVTILSIIVSWVCGLAAALGKMSSIRPIRLFSTFYIWFIRGTPTLIQIFIIYFGFPQFGIRLSPFAAGFIALGINSGAYIAEIIRSGMLAIPKGQVESAMAVGIGRRQIMTSIILPQVFRIILPALTNEAITSLKNTSLLSTITVVELTLYSQILIATTFRPFEFYTATALIYLIMTTVLTQISGYLERRNAHYS